MKQTIYLATILLLLSACGGATKKDTTGARPEDSKTATEHTAAAHISASGDSPVEVTIITDWRCVGEECDLTRFMAFIFSVFEGAKIQLLDYSTPTGRQLFEQSGANYLPMLVFSANLVEQETAYNLFNEEGLRPFGDTGGFYFQLGLTWDPAAEICNDGIDNTGDGLIDCAAPNCSAQMACRPEIKHKLDIFVMSQCPYGVLAVDAMGPVLDHFENKRSEINFEINFIGGEEDGRFRSLHGRPEIEENLRQICAQKHYGDNYKFMEYVLCRGEDYRSEDWQPCAKNGIDPQVIRACAEGIEGKQLLRASFAKSTELGIAGSPSWLLNNRHEIYVRDPADIKAAFCEKNPSAAGCDKELTVTEDAPGAPIEGGCET